LLKRPKALARVAAAVVAFLIGVFTLVEKLTPGGPPPAPEATISEPSATPKVQLRAFLDSEPGKLNAFVAKARAQGVSPAELIPVLDSKGVEATFTLDLSGQPGTAFGVMRNMFEVNGNVRIPEAGTTVVPPPSYVLNAPHEHFVDSTWIGDPPHTGRYYIELVVLDARGDVLAHESSGELYLNRARPHQTLRIGRSPGANSRRARG
jgi:hypothetical protein